jgi:hypothetical protein
MRRNRFAEERPPGSAARQTGQEGLGRRLEMHERWALKSLYICVLCNEATYKSQQTAWRPRFEDETHCR